MLYLHLYLHACPYSNPSSYLVESLPGLLPQPLVLVEQGDEGAHVHAVREGVEKVLAHVQTHIRAHQVVQPEQNDERGDGLG